MKAEEVFEISVRVMKELLSSKEMVESIRRSKERSEEENLALLEKHREEISELVRRVADEKGSGEALAGVSRNVVDAMVLRYLKNRELFMNTFPDGIESVDADAVALWAAMMISPYDEGPPEPDA